MENKLNIGDKVYTIKEILYKDLIELGDLDNKETPKKLMLLSTGMSEEDYNILSLKDGITIQKAINSFNGLADFQTPQE